MLSVAAIVLAALSPQDPTVRYKDLPVIVKGVAGRVEKGDKAVVVWLVDTSSSLRTLGSPLAAAMRGAFTKPGVRHSVVAFGEQSRLALKPTEGVEAAAKAVEALAAGPPDDAIKNTLGNVREAAKLAASVSGRVPKFVVLFTQDNHDNEDNLEATVRMLKSAKMTFLAIGPEAVYSDPYWASALSGTTYFFDVKKIRKLGFDMKGPESAFVEFPYGWPYAVVDPCYTVPSGTGPYALVRLARETGGAYWLHTPASAVFTFCQRYGCDLCAGRHQGCGATYDETKLGLTGPELGSRAEYGKRYGSEPLTASILTAWDALHRKGVIRGVPPLRVSGRRLSENRRPARSTPAPVPGGTQWDTIRRAALKSAGEVGKVADRLAADVKKSEAKSDRRVLATADSLVVHLRMLEQTYRQLALFTEEMERVMKGQAGDDGFASSRFELAPKDRVLTWHWRNVTLCHGGEPLKSYGFLGDRKELHRALDEAELLIEKHRGTPWEVLMRRASVSVFIPYIETEAMRAARAEAERRRPSSSGSTSRTEGTPGTPQRPARPARGTDGASRGSGTTTGGRP